MIKLQRICTCGATIDERTILNDSDFDEPGIHVSRGWLVIRMAHMKCQSCLEKLMNAS
jgi:hypothetical protein